MDQTRASGRSSASRMMTRADRPWATRHTLLPSCAARSRPSAQDPAPDVGQRLPPGAVKSSGVSAQIR